jgi:8-oxo-dGTP pyrophosphatase MutT (NUDIX family)
LRIRQAARAIVLTPLAEVLLVRFEFPMITMWALPGGGLHPGESPVDAVRRELVEEVGLHDPPVGPHVWTRLHVIPFLDGQWDGQHDTIHLVPVPDRFEPRPAFSAAELAAEHLHELRWWTVDDIDAPPTAEVDGGVVFAPRRLGALLRDLVDHGPPETPVDTGI